MKLKRIACFSCLLFVFWNLGYSESKQNINYSVSLGLGYQSLIFYTKSSSAAESFLTLNTNVVYYPTSFFALSYNLGIGVKPFFNADHIPESEQIYFPTELSRISVSTSLDVMFFGFTNNDSLLYCSFGPAYLYTDTASNTNPSATDSSYANSKNNKFLFKIAVGAEFALFQHMLMDAQVYIMLPIQKNRSWINIDSRKFHQIMLGFTVLLGYFG